MSVSIQNDLEFSFDLLFENNYQIGNPPSTPPPNNTGKHLKSPPIKWHNYNSETPPKFYLNQKFDYKGAHNKKYGQ